MPDAKAFDPKKLFNLIKFLASIIVKYGPLFAEDGTPLMRSAGELTPESVESELVAALDASASLPQAEPGMYGGPMIDHGIRTAIRSLADLLLTNTEAAVDIFNRVVAPRLPEFMDI